MLVGSGGGELLPLYVRFPSCEPEPSLGDDGVVAPRTTIEVSDLYLGRCGDSVSIATCLTPVNMERDRRWPSVGAAGVEGVVGERGIEEILVSKPGGAVEAGDVGARHRRESSVRGLVEGAVY
jgi:hypothetical protein